MVILFKRFLLISLLIYNAALMTVDARSWNAFMPSQMWPDTEGNHINAHGGGIMFHEGTYYWFGESKDAYTNRALAGVGCYTSTDLYNWKNNGVVLRVIDNDTTHELSSGCTLERPKVVYNAKTKKFVMWFHLELRNQGYKAARVGLAVANHPLGPYTFIRSYRPNKGRWPLNMPKSEQRLKRSTELPSKSWSPEWLNAIKNGYFVSRDFEGGQMSRDMTIFVDNDLKAYHIYASEENLTLQIAELSSDYQSHTGRYIRVAPTGHNEAPAVFYYKGRYFMITSGCTGWAPNAARLLVADSMMGEWKVFPNPCIGKGSEITFGGQSTFVLPVHGKKDSFIFMADKWTPLTPKYGGHIWLPIQFENGLPVIKWKDKWSLELFTK